MLRLHCAEVLDALRHQPIVLLGPPDGVPMIADLKDPQRQRKHTRPVDQQKWIKSYWRGAREAGVTDRSHYVVG